MFRLLLSILFTFALLSQVKGQKNYLNNICDDTLSGMVLTQNVSNVIVATTNIINSPIKTDTKCVPVLLFINKQSAQYTTTVIGDTTFINEELRHPKIVEILNDSQIAVIGIRIDGYLFTYCDYYIYKTIVNTNNQTLKTESYPLFFSEDIWPKFFDLKKLDFKHEHIYYGKCGIENYDANFLSFFIKTNQQDSLLYTKLELGEKDNTHGYPLGTILNRNDSLIAFNHETNKYGEINLLSPDSFNIINQYDIPGYSLVLNNRFNIGTAQENDNVYQIFACDSMFMQSGSVESIEKFAIRKLDLNNYSLKKGIVLTDYLEDPFSSVHTSFALMKNAISVNEAQNTVFAYLNFHNISRDSNQFILYKFDTALNIIWRKDFVFDQNNLFNRYTLEDMLQTNEGVYLIGKITDRSVNPFIQKNFLYFISNDGQVTGINNKELVAHTSYIYPNPAQTHFNVPLGTQKVNVINNLGQLVLNTDNPHNKTIDVSMLKPGIYIVQLFINNQWVSNKLVKP
jgi:hypothetical protein